MGMTSARKAAQVLANSEHSLAIELLAAAQGIDLRSPLKPGPATGRALEAVRGVSPRLTDDRSLAPDIGAVRQVMRDGTLLQAVAAETGSLL